jgi:hypothetical protein
MDLIFSSDQLYNIDYFFNGIPKFVRISIKISSFGG